MSSSGETMRSEPSLLALILTAPVSPAAFWNVVYDIRLKRYSPATRSACSAASAGGVTGAAGTG